MSDQKHLPLEALHEKAGARFGPFAGWRMPLTYPLGVMREHEHTRHAAGLFDISHMKLIEIMGADAANLLARACPLDAAALATGRSKYTLLMNEAAGILEDFIITRLDHERFMLVANAANAQADEMHLRGLSDGLAVTVTSLDRVFLALQGPKAEQVLEHIGLDVSSLVFMSAMEPRAGWFITRSGYTGEDGFEIALPIDEASQFAEKLLAHPDVEWIGLAARDSLRLEAGLCLYGQDIDEKTDPASAGILWAISKPVREMGRFIGAEALARIIDSGPKEVRVGLKPSGRQPVRAGTRILNHDGEYVGRVTSGGFGPSISHPISMGYVAASYKAPGTELFAEVRGNQLSITVHPLPFWPHRYHKGN